MGDHRASIKGEFSMYGITKKLDMSINWSPDSSECDGVDQRVIDFFRENYYSMRSVSDAREQKYHDEQRAKETEKAEREQLARLTAKYGTPPPALEKQP